MIRKMSTAPTPEEAKRLAAPDVDYMGPESGPFHCGHCAFFNAKISRCSHPDVMAPVQAGGCCDKYKPTTTKK